MESVKHTLSSIVDIISGGTPSTANPDYWNGDIGWLSVADFNNDQRFVYYSDKTITRNGLNNSSTKLLSIGDTIISARGTVGALAQIGNEMAFNQSCFGLRAKQEFLNEDFLYYSLRNYVKNLKAKSQGSVFDTINLSTFDMIELEIPSLPHQQKIASVLSTLDEKIALNNQINATLEQMAKTLYDYWFVQFDFPDENGKPYKSSDGEMMYNETLKREIPKGWDVKKLADWIKTDKSGDWGQEEPKGNYQLEVTCIRGADINPINNQGIIEAPTRFILEKNANKLLSDFDFVIEISGGSPTQSTGRIASISPSTLCRFDKPLICSNFCKAISLKDNSYFYNFAFLWNQIYENDILFGWEGKTSGIKNLLFDNFVQSYYEPLPPVEIADKFFQKMDVINSQQQTLLKQNAELTKLRDWLLPMLMNGQATVQ
ncbi:restriction endonuclease subunit S [Moraxella osloensis]|nr:restriction endonuclease subunit S [Moraxella osloensis]MBW4008919.1 restriction endonuclease subunit S [Moraxella osloensis]